MKCTANLMLNLFVAALLSSVCWAEAGKRSAEISLSHVRLRYERYTMFNYYGRVFNSKESARINELKQLLTKCETDGQRSAVSQQVRVMEAARDRALAQYDASVLREIKKDIAAVAEEISRSYGIDEVYLVDETGERERLLHSWDMPEIASRFEIFEMSTEAIERLNKAYAAQAKEV